MNNSIIQNLFKLVDKSQDNNSFIASLYNLHTSLKNLFHYQLFLHFLVSILAQKVDMATLPSLKAATDAKSGDYFGPKGLFEARVILCFPTE
jgi:hypothetical protein